MSIEKIIYRKHRTRSTSRQNHLDDNPPTCNYIGIWLCSAMIFVWLLILSYMMIMVHSETSKISIEMSKSKYKKYIKY